MDEADRIDDTGRGKATHPCQKEKRDMLTSAACIVTATMERIFHPGREEVLVKFRNQSQHEGNARGLQKCACSDTATTETNTTVSPIVDLMYAFADLF
jgi:hypothetical protein